jgi:Holliday junction resolvase RusA-like endonuclease
MLTEKQLRLIELDRKREEVKRFFDEYQKAVQDAVDESGIGHHFQDDQGVVYQLVELEGRWVNFDRLGVERTRRSGETRGSLSLKKAQELGYKVKEQV